MLLVAAVNIWNARPAAVGSWLAWCRDRDHDAPAVPVWARRPSAPVFWEAGTARLLKSRARGRCFAPIAVPARGR
ncbi:hypothetical protein [Actinomadura formosensis]|uniref:hypothetical protein n=1 Tax=Actinomadura formosensis TaxID=60706 RepID=UPI003D8F98F2